MKIATYNVNGISARLPVLLRWLEETAPDAVCLQELKAPQEKFPETALKDAGYSAAWLGQKSWNGVAILSRNLPIESVQTGLPGNDGDEQSRYIQAVVGGITIGGLYLPNGNPAPGPKFDYKLDWLAHFERHAAALVQSDRPVVLAGDYNIIPTEADVYRPERWVEDALFRPESRAAFQTLLQQGWTDALRHLYPGETIYTYYDYFRNAFGRNAGLRIDHLLLNPQLASRLTGAGVDRHIRGWEKSSDHCPVWMEVKDE
ncbi:exodeoxyribonuclease III [Pseudocnuella soli]|uniref:exodeoxyribonuclease III n=1 Tax=Pseudocnuella soli TaxID=2502779 RepID=UPI00104B46F5|nr:exodeoxyribonuclease III [Pseudocnuella soli]